MPLEEQFAATILKVEASFGFASFECDPNEITETLGLTPEETRRQGETRPLPDGKHFRVPFNSWHIESRVQSKDVNDHLRDLLAQLEGAHDSLDPTWGVPSFSITYKATHLYSGNGPFYEVDVIRGVASYGAELWQDIYAIEEHEDDARS